MWEQRDKLQALVVFALAIAAWRRGGQPEVWTATTLAGMSAAVQIFKLVEGSQKANLREVYSLIHPFYLALDMLALAAFVIVALRANRLYPILVAGCQLVSVMTHFASGLLATRFALAYAIFNIAPFYFMIIVMAGGLLAHILRERRLGPYPSWRASSHPSPAPARETLPPR